MLCADALSLGVLPLRLGERCRQVLEFRVACQFGCTRRREGLDELAHLEQAFQAGPAASQQVHDRIGNGPVVILRDEDAALVPFLYRDKAVELQCSNGFAHHDPTDAELDGQFALGGQPVQQAQMLREDSRYGRR